MSYFLLRYCAWYRSTHLHSSYLRPQSCEWKQMQMLQPKWFDQSILVCVNQIVLVTPKTSSSLWYLSATHFRFLAILILLRASLSGGFTVLITLCNQAGGMPSFSIGVNQAPVPKVEPSMNQKSCSCLAVSILSMSIIWFMNFLFCANQIGKYVVPSRLFYLLLHTCLCTYTLYTWNTH